MQDQQSVNCNSCLDFTLKKLDITNYYNITDVSDFVKSEIFNILKDDCLTSLLVGLQERNIIEYSDNIGNKFDEENEVKILDVNYLKLISDIELLGGKLCYDAEIVDIYYDFKDKRLDKGKNIDGDNVGKRSFRIRKKMDVEDYTTYYYTIKRKKGKIKKDIKKGFNKILDVITGEGKNSLINELSNFGNIILNNFKYFGKTPILRECYEKEFEIDTDNIDKFKLVLNSYGIEEYRSKNKKRISYYIIDDETKEEIKFDIDFYEEDGYPPLLEIEASNDKIALKYIKKLGLQNHQMLDTGFRGLVKYYKKLEKNEKKKSKI